MQVLKKPVVKREVKRVKLNQDYGLIKLEEIIIEKVRTHLDSSACYTQDVESVEPEIVVYDVWLGDGHANEYTKIQCGQSGELWFWAECRFCYVSYVTFECYAGKDTGWENLIRRIEHYPISGSDGCTDFHKIGMIVPWYGEDDPRSGDVEEFLKKAGLDCKAEEVKVCGKVIFES